MRKICRLIGRPSEEGPVDILLGGAIKGQTFFRPNRIYEATEILGELTIKDIGPSALGPRKQSLLGQNWDYAIGDILDTSGTHIYLTQEEYRRLCK